MNRLRWPVLGLALVWTYLGIGEPRMRPTFWPLAAICAGTVLGVPIVRKALWMRGRRRTARTPVGLLTPWHLDEVAWRESPGPLQLTASPPYARWLGVILLCSAWIWYALEMTGTWRTEWALALAAISGGVGSLLTSRGRARSSLKRTWPVFVGERVQLDYHFDKLRGRPAVFDRLTLTLRCLTETERAGGLLRPEVRCLWSAQAVHGDDLPPGPVTVCAAFQLPPDAPGTDVLAEPAVFRDLLVEGDGEGFAFRQEFLVPVYAEIEGWG